MKINEAEKLLEIPKATIRYYNEKRIVWICSGSLHNDVTGCIAERRQTIDS